jgi:hypothetical protein
MVRRPLELTTADAPNSFPRCGKSARSRAEGKPDPEWRLSQPETHLNAVEIQCCGLRLAPAHQASVPLPQSLQEGEQVTQLLT